MNTSWLFRAAALLTAVLTACEAPRCAQAQVKTTSDSSETSTEGLELFTKSVRGILVHRCLKCHGSHSRKADFDLSTRDSLMQSGHVDSAPPDSHFMRVIRRQEEPFMPHKERKLSERELDDIERWLALGAPYDRPLDDSLTESVQFTVTDEDRRFWSFADVRDEPPPSVALESWIRTDVDRFILQQLEQRNVRPNPIASREVLIRRAYFDLIGLPPTPFEVTQFLEDEAPDAYRRMVDRLLESNHFGQRWARHWLDVARFAESSGFEHDDDRPNAYHYRDFVIWAFNTDLPYDQFVQWQIAGDELAPETPLAMAATGFLGAGPFPTQLTETEFETARYDELDDMVMNTGLAFLGLSIGCARCHDHKYDPVPSRDYYRMAANFAKAVRSEVRMTLEPTAEPVLIQVTAEGYPPVKNYADDRGYPYYYDQVYLLTRGDVHQKGEAVQPGFPSVLTPKDADPATQHPEPPADWTRSDLRRTALARWLTDPQAGAGRLAARVIVNRLWQHHFGQGLVATPNDFGTQGERPSHPQLLDWLACELIRGGWRLKRIHRLIMTSSVYMQGDADDEDRARIDPENRLYGRRAPRRLEAEAIRDAMLRVAGLLDTRMAGPGTLDESMQRRSIYFTIKRSKLVPMMTLFDWPEHLVSIGRRAVTTTASQALLFMNGAHGRTCASGFAQRIAPLVKRDKEEHSDYRDAVEHAYMMAYARPPVAQETELAAAFLAQQKEAYQQQQSEQPEMLALTDFCQALFSGNEFIYVR